MIDIKQELIFFRRQANDGMSFKAAIELLVFTMAIILTYLAEREK